MKKLHDYKILVNNGNMVMTTFIFKRKALVSINILKSKVYKTIVGANINFYSITQFNCWPTGIQGVP